jgi:putative tryptophan/tyrosine transport system substrate-binding protein
VNRIIRSLALGLCCCAAEPASAQNVPPPLVGVMRIDNAVTVAPTAMMLREAFAAAGLVDGREIRLDFRLADGDPGRFPEMAATLVRDGASVIVASGDAAARAAQEATRSIPIVATTNDLVGSGLIASLAKPGGNMTGVSLMVTELDAKRLQVLKEIVPSGRHFGVLNDPAISGPAGLQAIGEVARALGVEVVRIDITKPAEISASIASLRNAGADGINVLSSPLFNGLREQLGPLLISQRLPAICEWREMAAAGCVASYGTTLREFYRMIAGLVARMLKGESPAVTPAQQPTKSELVINLKAARAIGIDIPHSIIARADEVIE